MLLTAAPLLLAIAGSALAPLPCAFSLAGVGNGTLLLIAIAIANDYTSVLMVRAASRLGGSGYEEVILAAGGREALSWCRLALVLLLFGTMCGCLAAIQETAIRAVSALCSPSLAELLDPWLLITATTFFLLPLSLASLGDMPQVAMLGVTMEICLALYVVYSATQVHLHGSSKVQYVFAAGLDHHDTINLFAPTPTLPRAFCHQPGGFDLWLCLLRPAVRRAITTHLTKRR